jgi:hypothetical protein
MPAVKRKRWRVLLPCLVVSLLIMCDGAYGDGLTHISVEVVEQETRVHLAGARVAVISERGGLLAEATTDDKGRAELRSISEKAKPSFVLVERQGCFVSGLRWVTGFHRYYIVMNVLEVK